MTPTAAVGEWGGSPHQAWQVCGCVQGAQRLGLVQPHPPQSQNCTGVMRAGPGGPSSVTQERPKPNPPTFWQGAWLIRTR